jgi:hypothetical protein
MSDAPTESNNMQSHAPKPILEGDIHFNPIIKYYRTFIYSPDQLKTYLEFKVCLMFGEFIMLTTPHRNCSLLSRKIYWM